MRRANVRSKNFFVIIVVCFSLNAMDEGSSNNTIFVPKPASKELRERVKDLVRVTFEDSVRAYMYRCPENEDVQLLKRYISIATDNYLRARSQNIPLPSKVTEQFLTSLVCKENLLAIVGVETIEDLKMRLGSLGILYDQHIPCNTWRHLLNVMQERIKVRARFYITPFNWPIKSLEDKPYNSGPH